MRSVLSVVCWTGLPAHARDGTMPISVRGESFFQDIISLQAFEDAKSPICRETQEE